MSFSTPEFKVSLSADFSGDSTDSIYWIKAMRAYFAINSKLYSTNEIKVMTTLHKMSKGRGIDFSEMCYDQVSNTTINAKEKTFDKFAKNFETTFYPFDIKATTRSNLAKLTQKTFWEEDGTFNDSFQKFITNFQNLAAKAGISDKTTLIDHFFLRIDQQIATMILSMSTIPTMLNEWIEKAKTFHTQKMRIAVIRGRKGDPSFFTSRNPPPHDPNAMDVDAISLTKLTPVEWAHCIREKLCFRCWKPGHSASQHNQSTPCPQNIRTTNTSKPMNPTPQPNINPTPPVSAIKAYVQTLKMQGKDEAEVLQTLKLCYEDLSENIASVELEDF